MMVIPAIDLMKGVIVRLEKGDFGTMKHYREFGDPLQVAKKWEEEGAEMIHIVDLDAARGKGGNRRLIEKIVRGVRVPIQLGGGVRRAAMVEEVLRLGVERVILGTMAFERKPELVYLLREYGEKRVMVALDYSDNRVMVRGWSKATPFSVEEGLKSFLDLGVKKFLLTSISKDGLLKGPDYATLEVASKRGDAEIYAAGGVSSLRNLISLRRLGLRGVVVGKALYEGLFTLKDALRIVS